MSKTIWRGVVALATVLASLGVLASPASAAVLNGAVTGGTVTLINAAVTVTDDIPVPATVELGAGCVNGVTITTVGGTTSVTNWSITGWALVYRFKLGGVWYIMEETRTGGTQGTVTGNTLNVATLNLAFNIYVATNQADDATDCTHGTTRTCRFAGVTIPLQGVYAVDIHTPVTSDTATLNGTGNLGATTPPCNVPFTAYSNGMITFTNVVVHIVS